MDVDPDTISSVPPSVVRVYLPSAFTVISELSQYPLPSVSSAFNLLSFSLDIPNVLLDPDTDESLALLAAVLGLGVPSCHHLRTLRDGHFAAEKSGQKSIVLTAFAPKRFPLWIAMLIYQLGMSRDSQVAWANVLLWVEELEKTGNANANMLMHCVKQALGTLGWASDIITSPEAATQIGSPQLANFLGPTWLSDSSVDAAIHLIDSRCMLNGRDPTCLAVPMLTFQSIEAHRRSHSGPICELYWIKKPTHLERGIMGGSVQQLYIPAFVRGNHFTLFKVDLEQHTIMYSDSLVPHARHPAQQTANIIWWLQTMIPDSLWTEAPPNFNVPIQQDSHSCGVIVVSTIAADCLGFPPWTNEKHLNHHVAWFVWAADPNTDEVCRWFLSEMLCITDTIGNRLWID
jgi:hypothetical protein